VAGPDGSYTHSSFIYMIDREGHLRALMPFGHLADDYVHDVRILLASP
jgi:protein SCO1/2